MSEDKSKLQLIGEIAQANNKNLELIEELNDRENEIERLNKKIEQYENPEDMTLMFMWCEEKAKDEIKRLNNKEEQLIRRLEDLIIVGEQVENEWAVDICKMIIEELKGSNKQ